MDEFEKKLRELIEIKMRENISSEDKARWISEVLATSYASEDENGEILISGVNLLKTRELAEYAGKLSAASKNVMNQVKSIINPDLN